VIFMVAFTDISIRIIKLTFKVGSETLAKISQESIRIIKLTFKERFKLARLA